jgi:hypothetical protein
MPNIQKDALRNLDAMKEGGWQLFLPLLVSRSSLQPLCYGFASSIQSWSLCSRNGLRTYFNNNITSSKGVNLNARCSNKKIAQASGNLFLVSLR